MKKKLFLLMAMLAFSATLIAQNVGISGKVTDTSDLPVVGASILIKGTTTGTFTDIDGNFSLNVPAAATLEVSAIGYVSQTFTAGDKTVYNIRLEDDAELLESTVIVGYGTVKRTNFTGSVASYNVADSPIANLPNTTALDMLRGVAPGVQMTQSGVAGSAPTITIRGQKSIGGSPDPLIVLDGVIFKGQINDIDPNTIESMSVMKDATSLASYGSQAANGVIMITTKKGKIGKPTINAKASVSLVQQNYVPKLKSPEKYVELINARKGNPDPQDTGWMSTLEHENYLAGRSTDWIKECTQLGIQQEYSANVSGGTDGMNYMFGVSRSDNTNYIRGNRFIRNTVTSRINTNITRWLSAGLNFNWSSMADDGIRGSFARYYSPYASPRHEDGSMRKYIYGPDGEPTDNPMWTSGSGTVDSEYRGNAATIGGNVEIKFPWIKGLRYKITGNYTLRDFSTKRFYHEAYFWTAPDTDFSSAAADKYLGRANGYINQAKSTAWVLDNILTYTRDFGEHYVNATLVYTRDSDLKTGHNVSGTNFKSIGNTTLGFYGLTNATTHKIEDITYTLHNDIGYLARVNYSFKNKYHFNASFRRDGSSVFGIDRKWGNFPAVGVAWTISDESFMNSTRGWLDYLKLKVSWGINGNQSLAPYQTLSKMDMGMSGKDVGYFGGNPVYGEKMSTLGNPLLGWETTTSYNFGFETDLLKNRIHWEFDSYKSKTTDQIFSRVIPVMGAGISNQQATMGRVDNWGIESSVRANIMRKNDFRWDATLNFSMNRNKLVELYGDGKDDITNNLFIGESLGAIYGYEWGGIVQEEDVDFMKANGRVPGDIKEVDQLTIDTDGDGIPDMADGKITPDDRKILGFGKEAFRMSLQTTLSWKGFSLYALFNGSFSDRKYGKAINNVAHRSSTENMALLNTVDIPWWTPENRSNEYCRPNIDVNGNLYAIHNYGFVRLQDLNLSYTATSAWIKKLGVQSAQVFVSGNNLFFIAPDWKHSDPEVRSATSPQLRRTYTIGLNIRF